MLPRSPYDVKRVVDVRQAEAERRIRHEALLQEAAEARGRPASRRRRPLLGWLRRLRPAARSLRREAAH